jgi:hypothetical protein
MGGISPYQFPEWLEYVKVLSTPIVALVAALVAGSIAYQQWRTARDKLKFELFDKRIAVYQAANEFISDVLKDRGPSDEVLKVFYKKSREARWLFDKPVMDYMDELYFRAVDVQNCLGKIDMNRNIQLYDNNASKVVMQSSEEWGVHKIWFSEQFDVLVELLSAPLTLRH